MLQIKAENLTILILNISCNIWYSLSHTEQNQKVIILLRLSYRVIEIDQYSQI